MDELLLRMAPYVSVAEKRRQAERELAKLRKRGQVNRSRDGSRAARLPRVSGARRGAPTSNATATTRIACRADAAMSAMGSVVDLQIAKGEITAMVAGSDLYKIKIAIAPVTKARWKAICRDCAGTIDSLVELLQGRLAKGVMDRVCREGDGLFPSPGEIKLSCSCPDWADMCKHVAAVLYGVGARLDEKPQLLFVLRGVDENELIAGAGQDLPLSKATPGAAKVLDDSDVAALFGLEMAETARSDIPTARNAAQAVQDRKREHTVYQGEDAAGKARQVTTRVAEQARA